MTPQNVGLVEGREWQSLRVQVCQALGFESAPQKELKELATLLDRAYRDTIKRLPSNEAVRVERTNGKDRIVVTPLERLDELASLIKLREEVVSLLPCVDLPEVLLEIHARTGFADEFTHVSENAARVDNLAVSACAVLLAEACNIGLEPLVRRDVFDLPRGRLTLAPQNSIRTDNVEQAKV